MGSIQALRSESMALRAKTDTDLQVSGHLANVNKSLGGQLSQMMDGLQGVISERTKAYNGLVGKLNQSVNGKGGVGDRSVTWAFKAVTSTINFLSSLLNSGFVAASGAVAAGKAVYYGVLTAFWGVMTVASMIPPPYTPDSAKLQSFTDAGQTFAKYAGQAAAAASAAANMFASLADLLQVSLERDQMVLNLKSALYDYEKMASQLGMTSVDLSSAYTNPNPPFNGPGLEDSGAAKLLMKRDSIMPRFKAMRPETAYSNPGASPQNRGYIGTLRRI